MGWRYEATYIDGEWRNNNAKVIIPTIWCQLHPTWAKTNQRERVLNKEYILFKVN